MNKIPTLMAAFATIIVITACVDDLTPDLPNKEDNPTSNLPPKTGITFDNSENIQGTYVIVGEPALHEVTTKAWLSTLREGEYRVYFSNVSPEGDVISVSGQNPIFIGQTTFSITNADSKTISVPVKEISSKLSFKLDKNIKISRLLISGIQKSVLIDGGFNEMYPTLQLQTKEMTSFYYYIVAKSAELTVSVDLLDESGQIKDVKVFKQKIEVQPGHQYAIKIGDGLSISD